MKKLISILGGAGIILGCFLPAIHMPLFGSMCYFQGADGQMVAGLGVAAMLLAVCNLAGVAAIPGLLGGGIALYDFFHMFASMGAPNTDNALANSMIKVTSPGEGWAVIFIGTFLTFVALFVKRQQVDQSKLQSWYVQHEQQQTQQPVVQATTVPERTGPSVAVKLMRWCARYDE
jgi:hypothetical protein